MNLISAANAPIAAKHQIEIGSFSQFEFASITTLMSIDAKIYGEPMIERFARDQVGREFLIAIHPDNQAEVFVHKRHLIDRSEQKNEFNRTGTTNKIVPTHHNGKPYETSSRRTLAASAKA